MDFYGNLRKKRLQTLLRNICISLLLCTYGSILKAFSNTVIANLKIVFFSYDKTKNRTIADKPEFRMNEYRKDFSVRVYI